jgi:AP endonuclease-2
MRLVTWNINGIRSLKVDWKDVLSSLDADIICLQETKVTSEFFKVTSKSI